MKQVNILMLALVVLLRVWMGIASLLMILRHM